MYRVICLRTCVSNLHLNVAVFKFIRLFYLYIFFCSIQIKQRIEETSSEDDSPVNISTENLLGKESVWSENWQLQKRISGTNSPVPVPMLVPHPAVETKVLIGDREAEDTSDLSETESDFTASEVYSDIKNILVDSRTIIGGKNIIKSLEIINVEDDAEADGEIEVEVSTENVKSEDKFEKVRETTVEISGHQNSSDNSIERLEFINEISKYSSSIFFFNSCIRFEAIYLTREEELYYIRKYFPQRIN